VNNTGYWFVDTGSIVRGMLVGLGIWVSCCCVCCGVRAVVMKIILALRERRGEAAVLGEAARGLAELELFLAARSVGGADRKPPDADSGKQSPA
jgi:hypothetical protein